MKTTILAALVLALFPTRLGEPMPAHRSDAAHFIGYEIDPRAYVRHRASRSGWIGREWRCLDALLKREANYRVTAKNPEPVIQNGIAKHAYGVFQEVGLAPGTPLETQVRRGLTYVRNRYGSPCVAYKHHIRRGWY